MEKTYSELLERQQKQLEMLLQQRFNDIEKTHKMGASHEDVTRLSAKYDDMQREQGEKHKQERKAFLLVPEQPKPPIAPDMTERANEIHERIKKKMEQQRDRSDRGQDRDR